MGLLFVIVSALAVCCAYRVGRSTGDVVGWRRGYRDAATRRRAIASHRRNRPALWWLR